MANPFDRFDTPAVKTVSNPFDRFDAAVPAPVSASPPPAAAPMSRLDRFGTGIADPIQGGAQLLAHALPTPVAEGITRANNWLAEHGVPVAEIPAGGLDQMIRSREASIKAGEKAAGVNGTDWYRLAGNVLSPANWAAARLRNPLVAGVTSGILTPVTEGDFWEQKAEQAGIGGAVGVAGNALSKAGAPVLKKSADLLRKEGVELTPGQMAGGRVKTAEDKLTSVPLTGDAIASAQRRAMDTFNRAAINRTLDPIGQKLPNNLVAGRGAITYAGDKIGAAYDKILPQTHLKLDPQFLNDIQGLRSLTSYMPPAQQSQFLKILNDRVIQRFTGRGGMDGRTLQQIRSELRNFARAYQRSPDAAQRQLGDVVATVDLHLGQALERQNPAQAKALKAADSAYARLVRVENAAGRRSISEGHFTPGDLLASIRGADGSVRHRAFSRGDGLMQDLAEAAQNVIGNRYPDSGSIGRLLATEGAAYMLGHPGAIVGLAAGAIPYTRPATNLLQKYAAPAGPTRNYLAQAVRRWAPLLTPAAQSAANGLIQ